MVLFQNLRKVKVGYDPIFIPKNSRKTFAEINHKMNYLTDSKR